MGQKQNKQQKNKDDRYGNKEKQPIELEFKMAQQQIDDKGLSDLAIKIASNKSHLKVLKLDLSQNIIGDQGLAELSEIGNCSILTELNLNLSQQNSQKQITDEGLLILYGFLTKLKNIQTLDIDLSTNKIAGENRGILSLLSDLPNLKKLTINLNNNQFGYRGMFGLSKILLYCRDLRYLNIQIRNNGFETIALEQFVMVFKYLTQIEHIIMDIQDNKVVNDIWIIMFELGIKSCNQLRSFVFYLQNNNIHLGNTYKKSNKYFHKMKLLVKADFKLI
ncbi:hypothetical protein ABPG74_019734 [Tetrahymena malaccensis]